LIASDDRHDVAQRAPRLYTIQRTIEDDMSVAEKSQKKSGGLGETVSVIVQALLLALVIRTLLFQPFSIPSGSMRPTLLEGDYLFVTKWSYGYSRYSLPFGPDIFSGRIWGSEPKRGDVVVFKFPPDPSVDYIKRVVGLPGDTVEVRQGQLYVNGQEIRRERIRMPCHYSEVTNAGVPDDHDCEHWVETLGSKVHDTILEPSHPATDFPRMVIPAGEVFVMGDNRDNSYDSRKWGTVNMDLIKGRALIIWWSRGNSKPWDPSAWLQAIRWRRFFTVVR
jgi:signal peptidase I